MVAQMLRGNHVLGSPARHGIVTQQCVKLTVGMRRVFWLFLDFGFFPFLSLVLDPPQQTQSRWAHKRRMT
jgi:hypothetical protein